MRRRPELMTELRTMGRTLIRKGFPLRQWRDRQRSKEIEVGPSLRRWTKAGTSVSDRTGLLDDGPPTKEVCYRVLTGCDLCLDL